MSPEAVTDVTRTVYEIIYLRGDLADSDELNSKIVGVSEGGGWMYYSLCMFPVEQGVSLDDFQVNKQLICTFFRICK